ncbi:hypothetical protein B0A48_14321 [Cryoendolithus antarcticus]|uniref:Uncharacterized protein n=1 Tax=Cryoendolithus antarcticus TaxID=1507870 RepID=A0A1V8SJK2_9PEZI|nr:hypothetical protein B0A48_14321 [Cryoendolithus antarcticus]
MHRTKVFNWGEGNTLTYLVEAVLKMMSDTGGEAAWRAKSEAEIKAMLLAQFDECPMIITQLTIRHANNSIALEKIWRFTDANMIEYQTLIRKKGILLAHGAWSECLRQGGGLKADREELQKHYHKHMRDPSLLPDISMMSDVNLIPTHSLRMSRADNIEDFVAEYKDEMLFIEGMEQLAIDQEQPHGYFSNIVASHAST